MRQGVPARSVGKGIGHSLGALRIAGLTAQNEFKRQVDDWIRTCRATKPAPGAPGVLIPGDPEREAEIIRRTEGIPLSRPVVENLRVISRSIGIPLD